LFTSSGKKHQSRLTLVSRFSVTLFDHFLFVRFQEELRSHQGEKFLALWTPNQARDGFEIQFDVSTAGRTVGTVHCDHHVKERVRK
jgi:hypothetical protein